MRRIKAAGGNIVGGRLVSGLQLDELTGDVTAVVSRDRSGSEIVHPADGVVFAIGISGAWSWDHVMVAAGLSNLHAAAQNYQHINRCANMCPKCKGQSMPYGLQLKPVAAKADMMTLRSFCSKTDFSFD